jgi:hypothetical protein
MVYYRMEHMHIGHRLVQMTYRHGTNECILLDMSSNRVCHNRLVKEHWLLL